MIKKYSLDKARVMEFYQAMSNVKTFLAKENLQTLQLEKVAKTFNEKFTAFDEALTPVRKSDLTQKIQELDTQRDNLLSGFSAHLKACREGGRTEASPQRGEVWQRHSRKTYTGGDGHHYQPPPRHGTGLRTARPKNHRSQTMDGRSKKCKHRSGTAP